MPSATSVSPFPDCTLVLNVLHGLNGQFQFMSHLITRRKSFPPFRDVRSNLRLAELSMPQSSSALTALVATSPYCDQQASYARPHQWCPPAGNDGSGTQPGGQGGFDGSNDSGGGGGRRRRRGSRNGSGLGWPSVYDP